jgi:hypothetical protein
MRPGGRRRLGQTWLAAALLGMGLGVAGCSAGSPLAVYPVSGKVSLDGEPASGALVVFHAKAPVKKGDTVIRPSAQVQPDGTFQLTSLSSGDGAPAGDYAVTVQWNRLVKQGGDVVAGPNVVPREYTNPETTPLKVTVSTSPIELEPFQLARKKK